MCSSDLMTGPVGPVVARDLVRVCTRDWTLHPVQVDGLQRALDVAFSPDGDWVYVVDFGEFEFTETKHIKARAGSGRLLRMPASSLDDTTMNNLQANGRVSFERDIAPLFAQFRSSMLWRLDLTRYEDMKLNASMVFSQIKDEIMPPAPYPPMTKQQVALFQTWMEQGFPL